jgi:hypothetical protein
MICRLAPDWCFALTFEMQEVKSKQMVWSVEESWLRELPDIHPSAESMAQFI